MKKRFTLPALLLVLCLIASCAWAQNEGDFAYSVSDGEARITAYTGSASRLILPDTMGGYPVTSIGICAFRNCTSLTHVEIPDGVTRIGSRAFKNCTSLEQILIPPSVTRIDTHAFYACSSLEQIALHDNIDQVNILAFYGCSAARHCRRASLTAYVLTDVGYSFTDPAYPQLTLKAFEDDQGQRTFTVADCDTAAVSVVFPASVTAIERYAFSGCASLTEIVIPDSVAEIAEAAFQNCASLAQITLPEGIKKIAGNAFSGCASLTVIAPPESAGHAFAQANGLAWRAP